MPLVPLVIAAVVILALFVMALRKRAAFADPPEQRESLTVEEEEVIRGYVAGYFEAKGKTVEFLGTLVHVHAEGADSGEFNISSVLQECTGEDRARWKNIVQNEFDNKQTNHQHELSLSAINGTYDSVRPVLAVQLQPKDFLTIVGRETVVAREELAGTVTVLMYRFPDWTRPVRPDEIVAWNIQTDKLFEDALHNCVQLEKTFAAEDIGMGGRCFVLRSDSPFDICLAISPSFPPELLGPQGVYFALPTHHTGIFLPAASSAPEAAASLLVPRLLQEYEHAGDPLSPHLYWHHDGQTAVVNYRLDGPLIVVTQPWSPDLTSTLSDESLTA